MEPNQPVSPSPTPPSPADPTPPAAAKQPFDVAAADAESAVVSTGSGVVQPGGMPSPLNIAPAPSAPSQPTVPNSSTPPVVPTQGVGTNPAGAPFGQSTPPPKSARSKKPLVIGAFAIVLLVLAGLGGYFGYYVPNKPENAYKTGVTRTGEAIDKIVLEATDEKKLEQIKASELTGSVELTGPNGAKYSGTLNSVYDTKNSDTTATYKQASSATGGQDFTVQVLSELAEGKIYPDIFFKVKGLKGLGSLGVSPKIASLDDKWVVASSDYIASIAATRNAPTEQKEDINYKDSADLAKNISATTREYVFSADPNKAVLVQKSYVGTEQVDGYTAYHYTVGVNKTNAKKYCEALIGVVMSSSAYKKVSTTPENEQDKTKQKTIEDCNKSIDNDLKDSDTFDMWVDKKYKLIYKIRFSDEKDKSTYVEIGQTYKLGSKNIPLFFVYHSDKEHYNVKATLDVDSSTNMTKGTLTGDFGDKDKYSLKADFSFKPHEGEVKITKPQNPVRFQDALSALGFGEEEIKSGAGVLGDKFEQLGHVL